jgi:uncharacterized membrane protein YdfJ with MMPL/SSD domain
MADWFARNEPNYQYLVKSVTAEDDRGRTASTIILSTVFNPMTQRMRTFIDSARKVVEDWPKTEFNFTFGGLDVDITDVMHTSYKRFGIMIGLTAAVVAIFVAVAMRSLVVPFRLIVSIGLTVVWTYGFNTWIFCDGMLNWISTSISKDNAQFYWLMPLFLTTIIIGLGCDYDVFLFARITELRSEGLSVRESIRQGFFHTGEVITGAGVVMAIAFCGLAASKMSALRQAGFLLASSVLLDTFVIRMLLMPGLLFALGRWNWWPSALHRADFQGHEVCDGSIDPTSRAPDSTYVPSALDTSTLIGGK